MKNVIKYPRTLHIEGSLRKGEEPTTQVPWAKLAGHYLVVEESMEGANASVWFSNAGLLVLHTRTRAADDVQGFKQWAAVHQRALWQTLGSRFGMYGRWIPGPDNSDGPRGRFVELDVFDRERNAFLSTSARRSLLQDLPVKMVHVICEGTFPSLVSLAAIASGSPLGAMWEGEVDAGTSLYIKLERDGIVRDRYRWRPRPRANLSRLAIPPYNAAPN